MQAEYIPYSKTKAFSKLVVDYLNDEENLRPFYGYRPSLKGIDEAIQKHQFRGNREVLVKALRNQYTNVTTHESVTKNIGKLLDDNAFTITTGHQLNLFTGPLYFIYKIVTAINLSRELNTKYPDKQFIPVYWMATEDHDFEEINHVNIEGKKVSWEIDSKGATGRINTEDIAATVAEYKGFLGLSENGTELATIIEEAYLIHKNLAASTRYLVDKLFGKYGLVIIDADDRELKKQFSSIMSDDIVQMHSYKNIDSATDKLTSAGYSGQVNGREINFFYLKDQLRERIVQSGENFLINNTEINFTKEELIQEIIEFPERFSPNVVMRPLYQEFILPNLAYIGGGAEVAYWMQLKENFEFYHVSFPVLILRNSAMIIDKRSATNLKNLGLLPEDVFKTTDELKSKWVVDHVAENISLSTAEKELARLFNTIKNQVGIVDKTLIASADSAKTKTSKLIERLEKKMLRAEKKKHEYVLQQIDTIKLRLFPAGSLQERITNLAPMYVNYGDNFISSLIEHLHPLDGMFTILLADE